MLNAENELKENAVNIANWNKDLSKEAWVSTGVFWKMTDILSKGILSDRNDQDRGQFRRGNRAKFASISQLVEEIEYKLKTSAEIQKKDASNSQKEILD